MTSTVSDRMYELRQAASHAALNYEIWWVYKSSETRPVYIDTMNRYPIFFHTAIHAHFVAMIIALYRIFETREDTHNFRGLLRELVNEFDADNSDVQTFRERYRDLKPTWVKISKLRNNAFGHRNSEATIKEVFAEVAVSPNEFRDFIIQTQELLNDISRQYLHSAHAFNTGAREQALALLSDLKGAESDGA